MRLWPRKQREKEPEVEQQPQPAKRPQSGEDLRKAFLEKLESRSADEDA